MIQPEHRLWIAVLTQAAADCIYPFKHYTTEDKDFATTNWRGEFAKQYKEIIKKYKSRKFKRKDWFTPKNFQAFEEGKSFCLNETGDWARERIEICERAEVCPRRFRLNVLDQMAELERYKKMYLEETQKIDIELAEK